MDTFKSCVVLHKHYRTTEKGTRAQVTKITVLELPSLNFLLSYITDDLNCVTVLLHLAISWSVQCAHSISKDWPVPRILCSHFFFKELSFLSSRKKTRLRFCLFFFFFPPRQTLSVVGQYMPVLSLHKSLMLQSRLFWNFSDSAEMLPYFLVITELSPQILSFHV